MVERNSQETINTESQDTALAVNTSPKETALVSASTSTTSVAIVGINATSQLTYQVDGNYFYLTNKPVESNPNIKPIVSDDEKISLADLVTSVGISIDADARKRMVAKVLTHQQWLAMFRAEADELPENLVGISKLRDIGRFDALVAAIQAIKFESQPKDSNEEFNRIAKFLGESFERAKTGKASQPRFCF